MVDDLARMGVGILPSLLDAEACKAMREGAAAMFRDLIDEPMPHVLYKLYPIHGMLLQHWGVGQAQWVWDVRTHPAVAQAFADLWQCDPTELICSFDGLSYAPPHEITKRGYYRGNDWFHCDQRYTQPNARQPQAQRVNHQQAVAEAVECYQGWVTAHDVRPGDATLTYLEGSHLLHREFAATFPEAVEKSKSDWLKLDEKQLAWYKERCPVRTVVCPAGSLVLWDSRTIHAGKEALKDRAQPNERLVVYVCMTPREKATKAVLKKRIAAFEAQRMTTHWPHRCKLFPLSPRTYGGELPPVRKLPMPVLNELGRCLVGYEKSVKRLKSM
jgi:Phytanoyl-CoA dioxygenase (PhyH)